MLGIRKLANLESQDSDTSPSGMCQIITLSPQGNKYKLRLQTTTRISKTTKGWQATVQ